MKKINIKTIKEVVAVVNFSDFEHMSKKGFRNSSEIIELVKDHLPPYDKSEVCVFDKKIVFYQYIDVITIENEKVQ
jgi:hypothetical protein